MNRIMPEVLRWQSQTRLSKTPDRWTGWVYSIIRRYLRIPLLYRTLVMVLTQPAVPLYVLCERWEHHAWRLYPKINLAIGLILQTIGKYSPMNKEVHVKQPSEVKPGGYNRSEVRSFSSTKVFYVRDTARRGHVWPELNSLTQEKTHEFNPPDGSWQAPLKQLLARMNMRDSLTFLSHGLIEQENYKILRRVVRERRRVEEGINRNTNGTFAIPTKPSVPEMIVVRKQKDFISVDADRTEIESQHTPGTGARMVSQTSSPPTINVEQLTEYVIRRIDHRIRAHRERKGKAF